jgi:hypothetical protein
LGALAFGGGVFEEEVFKKNLLHFHQQSCNINITLLFLRVYYSAIHGIHFVSCKNHYTLAVQI